MNYSKQLDRWAKGNGNPRLRIPVPKPEQRCPRCHHKAPKMTPCALCAPNKQKRQAMNGRLAGLEKSMETPG